MPNRLANETSPYLLQHQDNPVDWYPWGDEALNRARTEDRPILLSVGYSACHWCHVMEHESFANPETAAMMNENFINIKVDREERPDVDSLYMHAVQQMTGHGGWPMTVFLTPEGDPFYGGTYFPPEPRHGLPSFRQLLAAIAAAYRDRRDEVVRTSSELRDMLRKAMLVNPDPGGLEAPSMHRAFHGLATKFDHRHGGFGPAPKFPQPMLLDFLLRYWSHTGNGDALDIVRRTLDAMAHGGIYDHLGGGFHRYSVDARWLVPHFEKMLYDNALLARIYLRAYQVTENEEYRRIATETLEYVAREMRLENGAFCSSQDADSEGEEGTFYVWTADQVDDILGTDEGPSFRMYFDVTRGGNWEGHSILHTPRPLEEVATDLGVPIPHLQDVVDRGRALLREERGNRVWPGRDDKALTAWNAMMCHTFAEAGRVLESARYVSIAVENANFILSGLRSNDGLLRSWRDGDARIPGFLEDYACLTDALVELYYADYDPRWVREARWVADLMIARFWDVDQEMFFDTPVDSESPLIVRPRDIHDNAVPSGTSSAVQALARLARLSGESDYDRIANRVIEGMGDMASRIPQAFGHLLGAMVAHFTPPTEVAIVGEPGAVDTNALLKTVRIRYLPHTVVAFRPATADPDLPSLIPLLSDRHMLDGRAAAYVCQHYSCRRPVTSANDLAAEIDEIIRR